MKWFIKVLRQYADFGGRARRKEYWMYTLFNFVFASILFMAGNTISGVRILCVIYMLGMIIPSLAVAVRRLHDTGRSGWWLLLLSPYVCMIPLAIAIILQGRSSPDEGIAALLGLCSFLGFAGVIWLIVLLTNDSQEGSNQYGEDPKLVMPAISDGQITPGVSQQPHGTVQPAPAEQTATEAPHQNRDVMQPVASEVLAGLIIPEALQHLYKSPQPVVPVTPADQAVPEDTQEPDGEVSQPPEAKENISPPTKRKVYNISFVCMITGVVMILVFVLLTQTGLLSYLTPETMSGDLIIEQESTSEIFENINLDDWSAEHLPGYIKQSYLMNIEKYFWAAIVIGGILIVVGFVLLTGYSLRKANPQPAAPRPSAPPANVRNDNPQNSTPHTGQSRNYPLYTGIRLCEVCNRPLIGATAYLVPNSVFYASQQWREYFKQASKDKPVTDAYIEQMRRNDPSDSAVCENCIHMF
jgi:uncharacterized membrane protein YhaH (DUF805 family)